MNSINAFHEIDMPYIVHVSDIVDEEDVLDAVVDVVARM